MRFFPLVLASGVFQYPAARGIRQRVIENTTPDGTRHRRLDHGHGFLNWDLTFDSITNQQRHSLDTFFEECRGSLHGFLFLDPFQNLVRQSEAFEHSAWVKEPGATVVDGQFDPFGTFRARRISNGTAISRSLIQRLPIPAWFPYSASCWMRADSDTDIELVVHPASGAEVASVTVSSTWKRYSIAYRFNTGEVEIAVGLRIPANTEIYAFGFQLEQFETVSEYKPTQDGGGVHSDARFAEDEIRWVTTGVDHHSTRISVRSRVPL